MTLPVKMSLSPMTLTLKENAWYYAIFKLKYINTDNLEIKMAKTCYYNYGIITKTGQKCEKHTCDILKTICLPNELITGL